jgi:hypothetical protein
MRRMVVGGGYSTNKDSDEPLFRSFDLKAAGKRRCVLLGNRSCFYKAKNIQWMPLIGDGARIGKQE